MFASLKEKFHNVQEEITTSLRNLKLDRHSGRGDSSTSSYRRKQEKDICNYDAGLELLERYQNYWTEIHAKTEITALCASEVDEIIQSLHENYESQWKTVGKLSTSLALIPQLVHGVQEICDSVLNVQCAFEETEAALLMLEDMVETQELREKQLDHRFQLALYQEKRASELQDLKERLTEEHLRKMAEYEKVRDVHLKERQAVFQEAFEEDLQRFKSEGALPKTKASGMGKSTPSLEEIVLEEDPAALETFLAEEAEEGKSNAGVEKEQLGKEKDNERESTSESGDKDRTDTVGKNPNTKDEIG